MLKELKFADLILSRDGTAYMKGTPEHGQQLVPVPESCREEWDVLLQTSVRLFTDEDPLARHRIRHEDCAYRVSLYDDVGSGSTFFLRKLPDDVPDIHSLGLPQQILDFLLAKEQCKGLLIFSGGQADGKTTSASALTAGRLIRHGGHGITFECPDELPLSGPKGEFGHCYQTNIRREKDLPDHIAAAHAKSSPNIIYIGEITTKYAATEALRVALGSSQQLVIATIHGFHLKASLERLLMFAADIDGQIARQNLGQTLLGIIHQELSDRGDNTRSLLVPEFLLLPFNKEHLLYEQAESVRAKIRMGDLGLDDAIRGMRNRVLLSG